jgi:hypothetical protein
MGKIMKTILIIAAAMIVAGVILAIAGLAFGGFRSVHVGPGGFFTAWRPGESEVENISESFDSFDGVEVDVEVCTVILREAEAYEVKVRNLYANTRERPEIRVVDGVLTVRGEDDDPEFGRRGFLSRMALFFPYIGSDDWGEAPTVEISYPRGARFGEVRVESEAGSVDIKNLEAASLSVESDAGSLKIEKAAVGELRVSLSAGECEIKNTSADSAAVAMEAGRFSARGFDCGALDGDFNMGEVDVEGSLRGEVDIRSTMGSVLLKTDLPESEYRVDLDVSLGSATVGGRVVSGGPISSISTGSDDPAAAPHKIYVNAAMGSVVINFAE